MFGIILLPSPELDHQFLPGDLDKNIFPGGRELSNQKNFFGVTQGIGDINSWN